MGTLLELPLAAVIIIVSSMIAVPGTLICIVVRWVSAAHGVDLSHHSSHRQGGAA